MRVPSPWIPWMLALALTACATDGVPPVLDSRTPAPEDAAQPTAAGAPVRKAVIAAEHTWAGGRKPIGAEGTQVEVFAARVHQPTQLQVLANGDVLVAESDPEQPGTHRIRLLRDTDADGAADVQSVLVRGLNAPSGMALMNNALFVVAADGLMKFPYREGELKIVEAGESVARLPAELPAWSGDLVAGRDGGTLYLALGGDPQDQSDAGTVREINAEFGDKDQSVALPGTPVGLAWEFERDTLWALLAGEGGGPLRLVTVDHDADEDGAPLPSAEIPVEGAVAPSDLVNAFGNTLPARFAHGMFIGQYGAGVGKRVPEEGFGVLFVPFRDAKPTGEALEVLSGFIDDDGNILGRPVAVAVDSQGALLVADDVGNMIWRVTSAPAAPTAP